MSRPPVLTDAQKAEITRLRKSDPKQYSYDTLARMFGVSKTTVHLLFNPDLREKYNRLKQGSHAWRVYKERRRRRRNGTLDRTECEDRAIGERPDQAEVLRMLAAIPPDTRDLTGKLLGDPLPARSALNRKMSLSNSI